MDSTQQSVQITHPAPLAPAYLWVGPADLLHDKAVQFLQCMLCPNGGGDSCIACIQIADRQHHSLVWIEPEKNYTLDDIAIIHERRSFQLEDGSHFFFVLSKAETLSLQCSNNLLKSIEEPAPGYHYLLLADRLDTIVPTIQSRCLIDHTFSGRERLEHETLFAWFADTKKKNAVQFLKDLDASKIDEQQSLSLLARLMVHWRDELSEAIQNQDIQRYRAALKLSQALIKAHELLPMPGSSKLFWKDLFLEVQSLQTALSQ